MNEKKNGFSAIAIKRISPYIKHYKVAITQLTIFFTAVTAESISDKREEPWFKKILWGS